MSTAYRSLLTLCLLASPVLAQSSDAAQRCATLPDGDEALQACRDAIQADSLDAYAHHNFGWRLYRAQSLDSAMAHWTMAARRKPDYAKPHAALALGWLMRRGYANALAQADSAIQLAPNDPEGYSQRVQALAGLHREDDAIQTARRGVQLAPDDYRTYLALGATLLRKNPTEALNVFRTAATLHAPVTAVYTGLAGTSHQLGRYAEALAYADTALAADSSCVPAHQARIAVLKLLNRHDEMRRAEQTLMRLHPNDIALQTSYALYHWAGRDSLSHLADALVAADTGDRLPGRMMRGYTLLRAGRKTEAVHVLREFVQRHAADAEAWAALGQIEAMALHYKLALADWRTAATLDSTIFDRHPDLVQMRKELLQVSTEPPAATVADLAAPIPPDPPPPTTTQPERKPIVLGRVKPSTPPAKR